jgi:hypothetical protein
MRDELEQKLIQKYPELFADKDKPPTQSLMCFGCECDDGWFNILDNMCRLIHEHLKDKDYPYRFTQIKEKFGTLRVYDNGSDKYIFGVIDMAESMSHTTCEVCGNMARTKAAGIWLKTLCEHHAKEMNYSELKEEIC